jgi:DNA-binding beta-propeller fold protein YncE
VYSGQWSLPSGGYPVGIAVSPAGEVYVTNPQNDLVFKYNSTGTLLAQWTVPGRPLEMAFDAAGNVYVAAGNNGVQKFNSAGGYLSRFGGCCPYGIATDATGDVYVSDIQGSGFGRYTSTGTFVTGWGGEIDGEAECRSPGGMAMDGAGNLFVACVDGDQIVKYNNTGTLLSQFASGGSGNGQLYFPQAVALDAAGDVYVADRNNHRIQKFTASGAYVCQWGSYGSGDGQFSYPQGVAISADGTVYVADTVNGRVQRFVSAATPTRRSTWGQLKGIYR